MTENSSIYQERLSMLRALMRTLELDAVLIAHDDDYLSYELTPECERLAYLCGFTGSAGFAVVLNDDIELVNKKEPLTFKHHRGGEAVFEHHAAVFVDGRYKVQVKEQVDTSLFDCFNSAEVYPQDFLCSLLPKDARIGLDLQRVSYKFYKKLAADLAKADLKLVPVDECLVDAIWEDRPEPVLSLVEIYPDEYNGCPSMQKRQNLAKALRDEGLDATVISSPETICWLFNIRGRDRHCLPVINCRLVAYANEALEWYVNSKHLNDDLQSELEQHFGHIDIFPEDRFEDMLERLCAAHSRVYIDPAATNAAILNKLYEGGAEVVEGLGLCEIPKACKNDLELAGEHKAHLKDGVAMCRFLTWLDEYTDLEKNTDAETFAKDLEDVTEETLAQKAEQLRKVEGDYIEASFDTISALGPNAAMCHYNHKNVGKPRQLGLDGMYLIDSGAHFLEGTTDITRTIKVGNNVTPEMMKMFTVVLKCHIALATAVFPQGTSGWQLDALARRPLWDMGLDYEHGTGHGVGHLLSVHEGPQNISSRSSAVPLRPGMIVSIEPGFYKDGEYGIRLENLVVVTPCSAPNMSHMLCFEPLTLVPFDLRLIERELLTAREREWLNNYHQHVYNLITSTATTLSDLELNWLTAATAAI